MDVAVLDYNSGSVCIYRDVNIDEINEKYSEDLEQWLRDEKGHKSSESYFLTAESIPVYEE